MSDDRLVTALQALADVMRRLRRECPWDRRQTHDSLRRYLVEEVHEVLEALDQGDRDALRSELGDLLFQIWFHAEVASEDADGFDLADVAQTIRAKLVRRHPHVFGRAHADDAAAVKKNWEALKRAEGRQSALDGVPRGLPALLAAQCLQDKAASVGFDWPDVRGVIAKVREELDELEAELDRPDRSAAREHELGDVLFSIVNLARHLDLVAEDTLREANRRFDRRFRALEKLARERGLDPSTLDVDQLEALWQEIKRTNLE